MKRNNAKSKTNIKHARRTPIARKQLPLTKKEKSVLFKEFKDKLRNTLMEHVAFAAWLARQDEKLITSYTYFIKDSFLKSLIKDREQINYENGELRRLLLNGNLHQTLVSHQNKQQSSQS